MEMDALSDATMASEDSSIGSCYLRNILFSSIWTAMLEHFNSHEIILMNQAGHLIYLIKDT